MRAAGNDHRVAIVKVRVIGQRQRYDTALRPGALENLDDILEFAAVAVDDSDRDG